MAPPAPCQALNLTCDETCPFLDCLEDLRQESEPGKKKGNMLLARWQGRYSRKRIEYVGREVYVALTNGWLHDVVLPEARKVMAGESAVMERHQARVLVSILGGN